MRRPRFDATTALGLCLIAVPLTAYAQAADGPAGLTMFTPTVRACIAAPTDGACTDQRETLTLCAVDLDFTLCAPLFDAPAQVFQDPVQLEAARSMLSKVSLSPVSMEVTVQDSDGGTEAELADEAAPDEFQLSLDAVRTLDAEQQRALELLIADPEVTAALARFEQTPVDPGGAGVYPHALFALQRGQRGDGAHDSGQDDESIAAVELIEGRVPAADVRRSGDDFASLPVLDFDARQVRADGDSELDRAGLASLAMLAVGMEVAGGLVAARSAERVVIRHENTGLDLWSDDDAILRDAESQRWIERFDDGSSLTRWQRADGSWTVTIRDVTGRALWRERLMADGTSVELINDLGGEEAVDLSVLPAASPQELRVSDHTDLELAVALLQQAEADARALGRAFTLRQLRQTRALRDLLPVLSLEAIAFRVNSASVSAEEAQHLEQVGRLIERLIADDPRELFLVEGHTDATGPAAYNLVLSDRRAESVALALTESFAIPPENLVVQGYGARHLLIPTAAVEARNRRVVIRRMSPLLGL